MIRTAIISICLLACTFSSQGQLCPGGGVNFNSAVIFDPAWIYGCATGTSCNGGVVFDNRFSCEPTVAMDACALPPSCGVTVNNASDIWFKFYPTYSSITLACVQNTSFVIGIQAFDGSACGSLTEIGCALAGGPSSGVQLTLNGLDPGKLYYFRIFGSAPPVPQRTGLYCFCGTTGVQATILPVSLESLRAVVRDKVVELSFRKPAAGDDGAYEIEYSADGIAFQTVYRLAGISASAPDKIIYRHSPYNNSLSYYRLKRATPNGPYQYSALVKVTLQQRAIQIINEGLKNEINIEVFYRTVFSIVDLSGRVLQTATLMPGLHHISTASLSPGIYLIHDSEGRRAYKFVVSK